MVFHASCAKGDTLFGYGSACDLFPIVDIRGEFAGNEIFTYFKSFHRPLFDYSPRPNLGIVLERNYLYMHQSPHVVPAISDNAHGDD